MSLHQELLGSSASNGTNLSIFSRGTVELGLPQIVVVGSQSVGKSALIENISGVRLELIGPRFLSDFVIDNRPS